MTLATEHRFRFVTLVPQTVSLRQALVDAPELGALPRLWERPGRRKGEGESSHGTAVVRPYSWKTVTGAMQAWPWRFLVVESTHLAKAPAPRLAAAQHAEQGMLPARQQPWPRRTFACEAEARQAATLCLRELAPPPAPGLAGLLAGAGGHRDHRGPSPAGAPVGAGHQGAG
jgi:hypothetical protein